MQMSSVISECGLALTVRDARIKIIGKSAEYSMTDTEGDAIKEGKHDGLKCLTCGEGFDDVIDCVSTYL